MNKQDHKELTQAITLLGEVSLIIESLAESEREKYDNMPDGLRAGERGQAMSDAADALEEARDYLTSAGEQLDGIE